PTGMQWYCKGDFVSEINDESVDIHKKFGSVPTMHSTMHLYPVNGAAHRPSNGDTAWDKRDATWSMVIAGVDPEPKNAETITKWAKEYWEALHPYTMKGAYINFMMEEGDDRIKATYGENYGKLRKVKSKYDPDNLFHINQNIKPL
ncbi:MAG: BBE domain-containing protein, partial [Rhodohalobacter sp.]|uniref:BBE domain-containing protein n=1 Tax=Rhodohalobacter sp. TaxID=1974210 RepID=UPI00397671D4